MCWTQKRPRWSSQACASVQALHQWSCLSLGASACVLEVGALGLRQFLSKEPWGSLDLGISSWLRILPQPNLWPSQVPRPVPLRGQEERRGVGHVTGTKSKAHSPCFATNVVKAGQTQEIVKPNQALPSQRPWLALIMKRSYPHEHQ